MLGRCGKPAWKRPRKCPDLGLWPLNCKKMYFCGLYFVRTGHADQSPHHRPTLDLVSAPWPAACASQHGQDSVFSNPGPAAAGAFVQAPGTLLGDSFSAAHPLKAHLRGGRVGRGTLRFRRRCFGTTSCRRPYTGAAGGADPWPRLRDSGQPPPVRGLRRAPAPVPVYKMGAMRVHIHRLVEEN